MSSWLVYIAAGMLTAWVMAESRRLGLDTVDTVDRRAKKSSLKQQIKTFLKTFSGTSLNKTFS